MTVEDPCLCIAQLNLGTVVAFPAVMLYWRKICEPMVGRHILEDIVGRQYVDEHYPVDKFDLIAFSALKYRLVWTTKDDRARNCSPHCHTL
ncbi:hypothetical protein TNCV_1679201 [Trichonephila clavipes]|nr:hypothetical protein TNCV_1679201 [Trichonephila clavipes]